MKVPVAAAILVRYVSGTMPHELTLDALIDASQPKIILERVAKGMEHHAAISYAADLATIHAPMLTPFGSQSAILIGPQQWE